MKDSNMYTGLWQKYRPVILTMLRKAGENPEAYQLSKHEFDAINEKAKTGFAFSLEVEKGILVKTITKTAVAKDLLEVLKSSDTARSIMQENNIRISMGKDFLLKVSVN